MADERGTNVQEAFKRSSTGEGIPSYPSQMKEEIASEVDTPVPVQTPSFKEETASEIGAAVPLRVSLKKDDNDPERGAAVPIRSRDFQEETAAEIAAPVPLIRERERDDNRERAVGGAGLGTVALALSILSLFVLPILFGAAGIVLGFIARRRGAEGLGAWAIGIGAVSIIVGIFILPFF